MQILLGKCWLKQVFYIKDIMDLIFHPMDPKKGTPVTTCIRFSDSELEIRSSSPIEKPQLIVVFHESLLRTEKCMAGLTKDGTLIVNTEKKPDEIRKMIGLQSGTIVCVNALKIAVEEKSRVNTAMLGAICHAVPFLDEQAVIQVITDTFSKKYAALVFANIQTFHRGMNECHVQIFESNHEEIQATFSRSSSILGYATQPLGGAIINPGNSTLRDLSASRSGYIPEFLSDACIHCAACDLTCPDMCFVWTTIQDHHGRSFQHLLGIDYQYCKGCLRCIHACPTEALRTIRETDGFADEHRVMRSVNS